VDGRKEQQTNEGACTASVSLFLIGWLVGLGLVCISGETGTQVEYVTSA